MHTNQGFPETISGALGSKHLIFKALREHNEANRVSLA